MTCIRDGVGARVGSLLGFTIALTTACGSGASSDGRADSAASDDAGSIIFPHGHDGGRTHPGAEGGTVHAGPDSGPGSPDAAMGTTSPDGEAPRDAGMDARKASPVPLNVGAACTSGNACVGGDQPGCFPAANGPWPGGYCTATCTASSECGDQGVCVTNLAVDANDNPVGTCLLACTATTQCRTGYLCDTAAGPGYCAPDDCRVVPSVCTSNEICNQSTGGCTPTPLATGYPATFPAPPQVEDYGGRVLASPVLVPMFFSNDSDASVTIAQMTAFYEAIGQTNYWKGLLEYGVGAPAQVVPVMLGVAAPTTLEDGTQGSQLQQLLAQYIADGTGGTPQPGIDTLYILNFPSTTTITQGGGPSCTAFGGYHYDMKLSDGTPVPYAVIPRCPGASTGFTDLQVLTGTVSHELIEACTDPLPDFSPAYAFCDEPHVFFNEANNGSEIGDMCENDPEAFYEFDDLNFVVQRFWSNTSALAGHDPCVPNYDGEVFFNSVPVLSDSGVFAAYGNDGMVESTQIAVGASATLPIQLYSDAATTAWTVSVYDYVCFSTGNNGNVLLDITMTGSTCTTVSNPSDPCITQQCTGSNGDTLEATDQGPDGGEHGHE